MTLHIVGKRPLVGKITVGGAKNACLPILFAAYAVTGETVLDNLPAISDLGVAIRILEGIGVKTKWEGDSLRIDPDGARMGVRDSLTGSIRGSCYLLGSSLGKYGCVEFEDAGGCNFAMRPIDYHLDAFRKMGAVITKMPKGIRITAKSLQGCRLRFPQISVGATVNCVLAALFAKGRTVIENAASEPHVCDLLNYLVHCGASISGIGTCRLEVVGQRPLRGCRYRIAGDSLEGATYLLAGAMTGGSVKAEGFDPKELSAFCDLGNAMGIGIKTYQNGLLWEGAPRVGGHHVKALPYPAIPTDLQPLLAVALATLPDGGTLEDGVFPERFGYLSELNAFGADGRANKGVVYFPGKRELKGACVRARDLRGGAATLLAGLCAKGESRIEEGEILLRGYEYPVEKLRGLGAQARWE